MLDIGRRAEGGKAIYLIHHQLYGLKQNQQIIASHNIDGYLWVFSPKFFKITGHDMVAYIDQVNSMYGGKRLDLDHMTWGVASNLLDPFLYFGFYSMYQYVAYGKSDNPYPFIRFGQHASYLPAARYVLSPFGPEYNFSTPNQKHK